MFTKILKELADDPFFKIVECLQQNWAVLVEKNDSILVIFYGDTCGVFDEIAFDNRKEAETALQRNGFTKYLEDPKAQGFIGLPRGES